MGKVGKVIKMSFIMKKELISLFSDQKTKVRDKTKKN